MSGRHLCGLPGRALAHFAELGLEQAEAVMTDGARCYRRQSSSSGPCGCRARHIVTALTPRWNGKVERFIQR